MNIFVLESPSPSDLLREVNEANSLSSLGKMFGHRVVAFFLKNGRELVATIEYLAEFDLKDPEEDFFCFHFSCHGNDGGIAIGPNFIEWVDMFKILKPVFQNKVFEDKSLLIISACGANRQVLSNKINQAYATPEEQFFPPSFIIAYDDEEVAWKDALLSWTLLYHWLGKNKPTRSTMQNLIKRMKDAGFGKLKYSRWDAEQKKYLKFS